MRRYLREPRVCADTYKRMVEVWSGHSSPQPITLTVPLRFIRDLRAYCLAKQFQVYVDPARQKSWCRLTIHRPIAGEKEVAA